MKIHPNLTTQLIYVYFILINKTDGKHELPIKHLILSSALFDIEMDLLSVLYDFEVGYISSLLILYI